jgi:hypothetical protein
MDPSVAKKVVRYIGIVGDLVDVLRTVSKSIMQGDAQRVHAILDEDSLLRQEHEAAQAKAKAKFGDQDSGT